MAWVYVACGECNMKRRLIGREFNVGGDLTEEEKCECRAFEAEHLEHADYLLDLRFGGIFGGVAVDEDVDGIHRVAQRLGYKEAH